MYKYSVSVRALYSKFTARAPPTQGSGIVAPLSHQCSHW